MVLDVGTIGKIGGSILCMVLLIAIGAQGFKQNSKKHGNNGKSGGTGTTSSNDSTK